MEKPIISDAYVENELKKYKFSGMGVGVVKDGKVVLCKGYGYRDIEKKLPITEDTQWGIASCTKAFTATLAGMLADDGLVDLDRPIKEYLPDFQMYDPVATAQCTLRDMLCHRTGLGGYDAIWHEVGIDREVMWKRLRYLKPNKPFRGAVQYNNVIYAMAGHVLEKVAGKSWDEMIKTRIFEPLGMNDSSTSVKDMLKSDNYATPYWQSPDGPVKVEVMNVDLPGPAASVNSTLRDMLKWIQFNLDGGVTAEGKRLIKEETLKDIHTAQVRYLIWPWEVPEVPPIGGYAMGWYNDVYRGNPLYFHIGEIEGYGTMQWALPRKNIGIVVFNNTHKPCVLPQTSVIYTILDNLLGYEDGNWSERLYEQRDNYGALLEDWNLDLLAEGKPVEGTSLSHKPEEYVGIYENPGHGRLEIINENGEWICLYRSIRQKMIHRHYDVFTVPKVEMDTLYINTSISFLTSDIDGSIDSLAFRLYAQVEPIIFTKVKED